MITLDTLDQTLHSVKVGDGTDLLAINADGSLNITDNGGSITVDGSVTVSATDLDIRDLSHTQDSVKVGDGTDFLALNADGSVNITDNGGSLTVDGTVAVSSVGGTVTVSATDLDIRDLSHTQDSVKIGDGTDFLAVNADGSITVQANFAGFSTWQTKTVTATTTAGQLDGTPLASRLYVEIQNLGTHDIYVGPTSGVTTANGLKIAKGSSQSIQLDDGADIFCITSSGTADVRFAEYAA